MAHPVVHPWPAHAGIRRTSRILTASAIVALLPVSVTAQSSPGALPRASASRDTLTLTHAEARARALRGNPELRAQRLDVVAARGQARQAGILRYNPGADVITGAAGGAHPEFSLSQEFEIAGQRGLRRSVANAGVERAVAATSDATRTTMADVDRSFYRLIAAARRVALADEVLALNARLAQVTAKQLKEGETSKLDYNLSVIELGRSRAHLLEARRTQDETSLELRRLIGIQEQTAIVPQYDTQHRHAEIDSAGAVRITPSILGIDDTPTSGDTNVVLSLDTLVGLAIARRPDIVAQTAAVDEAARSVQLTRREAMPNLVARAVLQQDESTGRTIVRPGVGLSLPIFNRNQGDVQTRQALAEQASLNRAALLARVRSEVETAYRGYTAAALAVEVLESTVLGPARDNRRLLEAAYREGKVGLPVLLLIRNQVIDAEQDYWSAWLSEREAGAALASAVGVTAGALSMPTSGGAR